MRARLARQGISTEGIGDDLLKAFIRQRVEDFRAKAPMTPAEAATIILDGVREEQWRILVGEDAHVLDRLVREQPEMAYEPSLLSQLLEAGHFGGLVAAISQPESPSDGAGR